MTKSIGTLATRLSLAAVAASIAGSAFALNPQPLPPYKVPTMSVVHVQAPPAQLPR